MTAWDVHNLTDDALFWMSRHKDNMYGLWRYGSQPILHFIAYGRWLGVPPSWCAPMPQMARTGAPDTCPRRCRNKGGLGYNQSMTEAELASANVLHCAPRDAS